MSTLDMGTTVTLNDGVPIPLLGFGVFKIPDGADTIRAVREALDCGYRHIDTAAIYGNETAVGKAVAESGIAREDLFITTKVWIDDFGSRTTLDACAQSLRKLGMDYVDLYLLHWPVDETMMAAWEALQILQSEGKCRSIGVSNFTVPRFEKAFFPHTDMVPSVDQVEFHPFAFDRALLDYCRGKGIQLESWSPLTRAQRFDDPVVAEAARAYGKTPAQILIRWQLEHGIVTIPKSVQAARIRENADVFDFSIGTEHMAQLDGLDEGYSVAAWRPPPADDWY